MTNFASIRLLTTALAVAAMFTFSSSASQGQNHLIIDPRQPSYSILEQSMSRFNHSYARSYSSLVFDETRGQLIVAARDYLFRLSLDKLSWLEETHWPADDNGVRLCQDKGKSKEDCHNYIRVLHVHGERVLACGTYAFSPKCSWRSVEDIGVVLDGMSCVDSCPFSPHSNISSLLSSGPEGSVDLFIGSPADFSGLDSAIFRLPFHPPLSKSAESSTPTPQQSKDRLRTMKDNTKWLNAPEFVGSVEVGHFVYFFFREVAVELINFSKTVYSRVARVCKNDLGGGQSLLKGTWTTFLQARLNCSLPAEYPYDHIQSVAYLEEERLFYATFTTPENSTAGSAVCSFTLESIQESFAGPFKYQPSSNLTWESVNSTHAQSHCDSHGSNLSSSGNSSLEAEKYLLMDRAVQAKGLRVQPNSERFSHIAVDVITTKNDSVTHVLYVASRDGFIRKYSVSPSSQDAYLMEILYPFPKSSQLSDRHIKTMQFLKQQNALYIGTENEVIRLPSQRCKRFITGEQCKNSRDLYCSWQSELQECLPASPSKDPHVSYDWDQSITTTPTFSAPEKGEKVGSSIDGVSFWNESSNITKVAEQFKQGPPGPSEVDDIPVMAGIPGAQGQIGPTGPRGPAGDKGERGDSGPVGKEGPSGSKGEPGRDGLSGNPGQPGLPGAKGEQGTDGKMGPKGHAGEPGLPGSIGPAGKDGTNGINGVDGKDGEQGPAGPVGAQGPAGSPGINGVNGVPGSPGPIGPAGPPGPPGPTLTFPSFEKLKKKQGDRGKRSKLCKPIPPGSTSESCKRGASSQSDDESQRLSGSTVVANMEALLKSSDIRPVGTIVYLYKEGSLLVRVPKGWQYISMGNFVPLLTPPTTTIPALTTLKPLRPSVLDNLFPKITKFPSLRLVALNEPLSGDMGGIHRVDYACYRQARKAGLRGTFRALLASRVQNLDTIVRPSYRKYRVVNLRGQVLFRSWNDVFSGGRASEFVSALQQRRGIYSFNNRDILNDIVWPHKMVWHGAGPSNGERQLDSYCNAWTSSDVKTFGVAASLIGSSPSHQQQQKQSSSGGKLLAEDKFSCQNRFVVLCIEAKVSQQ